MGCRGVAQLGGPAPGFAQRGPAKVGACKSILFTESSRVIICLFSNPTCIILKILNILNSSSPSVKY